MKISILDAAYTGFALTRRKPWAVLSWAGVLIVLSALMSALASPWVIIMLEQAELLKGVIEPTPEQVAPAAQASMMVMLYSGVIGIFGGTILGSAVARSVLKPEDSRMAYLRLGRDELRVLVIMAMTVLMGFIVSLFALMLAAGLIQMAAVAPLMGMLALMVMVGTTALLACLMLRLSLAVPATLAEGRIGLKSSWRLTKGQVTPLMGMALMALFLTLLVSVLLSMVMTPLSVLMPISETSDPADRLQAMMAQGPIGLVIPSIMNGLLLAAQISLFYAPFSAVYQRLSQAR